MEGFQMSGALDGIRLVLGQTVCLEKDVSETDRYGRLLRYVWLGNGRMVREGLGHASAFTYPGKP
jgi:micrococcal nuclease